MRYFILLIGFLFLSVSSIAQELRIVKDNVNCSYGLKNKQGTWVIDPIYILIQEYSSGYFLVKDALGDGLLSPDGKWVIECKYDNLSAAQPKWRISGSRSQGIIPHPENDGFFFFGTIKDQTYLLNSQGKSVRKVDRSERVEFDGNNHVFIIKSGPKTTSYLDESGQVLIDQFQGEILPFGSNKYSLRGEAMERYKKVMSGNVQLIDRSGRNQLQEQFDRAVLVRDDRICFERNGHYGEMKVDGTMLIEPKYRRDVRLSSSQDRTVSWVIYDENNKVGLMRPDGTVAIEPIYDRIVKTKSSRGFKVFWRVTKDDKTGIVDDKGRFVLAANYEEITLVYRELRPSESTETNFILKKDGLFSYMVYGEYAREKKWYDQIEVIYTEDRRKGNDFAIGLVTKKDNKFGALSLDGKKEIRCVYDGHTMNDRQRVRHFFWKNLKVTEFDFRNLEENATEWEVKFKKERTILYSNTRSYMKGELSENEDKIIRLDARQQQFDLIGNMLVVDRPSTGDWDIYNIKTNKKVELKNIASIRSFYAEKFLLKTRDKRFGVIDENGKRWIKPIYFDIRTNNQSELLWVLTGKNDDGEDQWILVDEQGRKVFSDTIQSTFQVNSGDLLMKHKDKMGVFDSRELEWKIQPIYPCLFQSVGNFYIAAFAENKKGILRSDGTVLLPLEHEFISVFTNERFERDGMMPKDVQQIRWLVRDENNEMIVSQDGDAVSSTEQINAFKQSILFGDTILLDPFRNKVPDAPSMEELRSSYRNNGMQQLTLTPFESSRDHSNTMIRNFPVFDYSKLISNFHDLKQDQVRAMRRSFWSNTELKKQVFDSINVFWERSLNRCVDFYGRQVITVETEQTQLKDFQQDCTCSEHSHFQYQVYGRKGGVYRIDTIGENFASIAFIHHGAATDQFMTMSQPPLPPPPAEHLNFVYRNDEAMFIGLSDIFPSDSILLDEFILALQKRDDLQLECSSLEMMVQMIGGRFSLSESGLHLYYVNDYSRWGDDAIEFLIPIERLKLHVESKWIVPILKMP